MTIDEELSKLDENIRRLKIEYEAYFNGGAPRAPHDLVFRVESAIKKYSGEIRMRFSQRYKFNQLAQKYAVYNDLWRKKLKDLEEGRGPAARRRESGAASDDSFRLVCGDPGREPEKVGALLNALVRAKRKAGERVDNIDPARFAHFVSDKAAQVKQKLGCEQVQFSVTVEGGKVKFKAGKG